MSYFASSSSYSNSHIPSLGIYNFSKISKNLIERMWGVKNVYLVSFVVGPFESVFYETWTVDVKTGDWTATENYSHGSEESA